MSTFTVSKNLEQVPRGGDLGTWDTPTNNNWAVVDAALGGSVTIGLNNSNVVLSSPQYQASTIIFNSTLTASVSITFPTSFTGPYIIQNLCTGVGSFTITLTNGSGNQVVGCPPGTSFSIINDGINIKFHNFGLIGSYWDYAGSSLPNWISACTIAPYLICDGTVFNTGLYPVLLAVTGNNSLPDARGRFRATLNQGTGRLTTAGGGLDGNTYIVGGGAQSKILATTNLPPYTPAGTVAASATVDGNPAIGGSVANSGSGSGNAFPGAPVDVIAVAATFTGVAQGGVSVPFATVPPAYVGGLTLIRAG